MIHFYIVPALTDQAGQCRVVCREYPRKLDCAANYRATPHHWREAGVMSSRGTLVCLEASVDIWNDMKSCEPLMAGMQFEFEEKQYASV